MEGDPALGLVNRAQSRRLGGGAAALGGAAREAVPQWMALELGLHAEDTGAVAGLGEDHFRQKEQLPRPWAAGEAAGLLGGPRAVGVTRAVAGEALWSQESWPTPCDLRCHLFRQRLLPVGCGV